MRTEVVIWGAGGHATVVAETLAACPGYHLSGVLLDNEWHQSAEPCLRPLILGGRDALKPLLAKGIRHIIVAIGENRARLALSLELAATGFEFPTLISPRAYVSPSATVGSGSVIFPGALVNANAKIGRHCIVNSGSIIEHGSELGEGVHISPGAVLAGNVIIGRATWIGAGATVIEKITIGPGSLIGAGAVVVDNLPAGIVAFGNPARVRRPYGPA
jgi:sugar O-acyltransferase (sialic acid O-acetyltransferase NeuD family)